MFDQNLFTKHFHHPHQNMTNKNINTLLDDLSLLTIFDKLPTEELLIVGRVCSRWYFIRGKAGQVRTSLKLLIGNVLRGEKTIKHSRFLYIPTKRHLFDCVHSIEDDEHSRIDDFPKEKEEINEGDLLRINGTFTETDAEYLSKLFPNITYLITSVRSEPKDINPLIVMLKNWSPKLSTLKLYTYNQDLDHPNRNSDIPTNKLLLSALNSMQALRVLYFDFKSKLLLHERDRIEFPILGQLNEFCFNSYDSVNLDDFMVDSLVKYGNELNKVALPCNFDETDRLLCIPEQVAKSFTQIETHISAIELPSFHKFCNHFSQLTILNIALHLSPYERLDPFKLYRSIAQLEQLISLEIVTEGSILELLCFSPESTDDLNVQIDQLKCVSVKALSITLFTRLSNHSLTERFHFERIFPKLEIVIFHHEKLLCNHCKETNVQESDFEANCLRPMLFPFYMCDNMQAIASPPIGSVWFVENTQEVDDDDHHETADENIENGEIEEIEDELLEVGLEVKEVCLECCSGSD